MEGNKRRLASMAERYGLWIVEDDIYHDTAFDGSVHSPVKAYDGARRMVPSGKAFRQVRRAKMRLHDGRALVPAEAVADYLAAGYRRRLPALQSCLKRQSRELAALAAEVFPVGTRMTLPEGGMFLWLEFPEVVSCDRLFERALERGVCVTPSGTENGQ